MAENIKELMSATEAAEVLSKWFVNQAKKDFESARFRMSKDEPEIGEDCVIMLKGDHIPYFGHRVSQNYYQCGSLTMPVEDAELLFTLKVVIK